MTTRYYLVPLIDDDGLRAPKYIIDLGVTWGAMDYGIIDTALVAADVSDAQHTGLIANADVVAIPLNIDNTISLAALPLVSAQLENLKIPGNWVNTGHTYRQVLRMVGGLFQFAQRHRALSGKIIIPENINLGQSWGDLGQQTRLELQMTADSFNYNTTGVTAATTIRTILKALADQWGAQEFLLGRFTL